MSTGHPGRAWGLVAVTTLLLTATTLLLGARPVLAKTASAHRAIHAAPHPKSSKHKKRPRHKRLHRDWYVKAGAPPAGTGSRAAPFASLSAAARASRRGDRIIVLPGAGSLNGGITLKPHQTLVGAGPSVLKGGSSLPRIENTDGGAQHGDVVELANDDTVRNLAIGPAARGGIYGDNVTRVDVAGNDVGDTNTSCTLGFVIASFSIPTLTPHVGIPFSELTNGWAAIMFDATSGSEAVTATGNLVHNSTCSDGIDVRAMGSSKVNATVDDNDVTHLQQSPTFESILAIGMQTLGSATLHSTVDGNTETYVGTQYAEGQGNADSEGLFANSGGPSLLVEHAADNTFDHGLGHLSANCFEAAASDGGPTMKISFANSTCNTVPGDILEADNLGPNDTMDFDVNHVVAENTNWIGAPVQEQGEPGDDGDCMLAVAAGAGSTTDVNINHSVFEHCAADGLGVVANAVAGTGPIKAMHVSVENSTLADNTGNDLRLAWATPITSLEGVVQHSVITGGNASPVLLEDLDTSGDTHAQLDLGGGSLGSAGGNCFGSLGPLSFEIVNTQASAKHDWWGHPGGPDSGQVISAGGSLNTSDPLASAPPGCES